MSRSFDFKLVGRESDILSEQPVSNSEIHVPPLSPDEPCPPAHLDGGSQLKSDPKLQDMEILVVEDCPDQQRFIVKMLSKHGANVHLECNGDSAAYSVRRAGQSGQRFDAIIMDLLLEASNGIDATRKIITFDSDAVVIAITAHGSPEVEKEWRKAGCSAYLEKPVEIKLLIDALALVHSVSV